MITPLRERCLPRKSFVGWVADLSFRINPHLRRDARNDHPAIRCGEILPAVFVTAEEVTRLERVWICR